MYIHDNSRNRIAIKNSNDILVIIDVSTCNNMNYETIIIELEQ